MSAVNQSKAFGVSRYGRPVIALVRERRKGKGERKEGGGKKKREEEERGKEGETREMKGMTD